MWLKTQSFEFDEFRLLADEKILLRAEKPVSLTPKALQLLFVLVENHGRVVSKDELMQTVWEDSFVEESNLTFTVSVLRKALGDDKQNSRFIETVPKRGYRFVAEVKEIAEQNETKPETVQTANLPNSIKYFAVAALCVLLIIAATVAVWYARTNNFSTNPTVLNTPFTLEKLSTDGKVFNAIISPDGKNVVYSSGGNSDNQSLWLRELESGNNVELIAPTENFYGGLTFSPDGTFVYFARVPQKQRGEPLDIYRVSIFGGVPEKIISNAQGRMDISPDNKQISFVRCAYTKEENCALWIADAQNGQNERKLVVRPSPFRIPDHQFSLDGKRIAFAVGQSENSGNEFGLMELDLQTGFERELTAEKFFNIKGLQRLSDGNGWLITASRVPNRNFRMWQVTEKGEVSPATKDSESYSILSLDEKASRIVSTQIQPNFNLRLFSLENLSASKQSLTNATTVSFASNDKILFSSALSGNEEIWSVKADGTERRQLTNNPADEILPITATDGSAIFFASNRTGAVQIWRMNGDGTNQTQITKKEGGYPFFVSSNGEWIYYKHGLNRQLWRVSAKGENEQAILEQDSEYFAILPDASQVAYFQQQGTTNSIEIVSLSDEKKITKSILLPDSLSMFGGIVWMPDGKNLLYLLREKEQKNFTLWQQNINGENPQRLADFGNETISHFSIAPDGKTFAVAQGEWQHNAVLLKGLK